MAGDSQDRAPPTSSGPSGGSGSNPKAGPSIAFVHLSHPDDIRNRNVQAGIRRHVMKDIGRSRRKRPRRVAIPLEVQPRPASGGLGGPGGRPSDGRADALGLDVARPAGEALRPPRLLLPLNRLGILGVDLDDRALQIVHLSEPAAAGWLLDPMR